jgi:hypothetical protein
MKHGLILFFALLVSPAVFSNELNALTRVMTVQCSDTNGPRDLQQARLQLIWNKPLVSATLSSKFELVQQATAVYYVANKSSIMGEDVTVVPEVVQTPHFDYGYFNEMITEVKLTSVGSTRVYSLTWGGDRAGSAKVIYKVNNPKVADVYWSINGLPSHIPVQSCALDFK